MRENPNAEDLRNQGYEEVYSANASDYLYLCLKFGNQESRFREDYKSVIRIRNNDVSPSKIELWAKDPIPNSEKNPIPEYDKKLPYHPCPKCGLKGGLSRTSKIYDGEVHGGEVYGTTVHYYSCQKYGEIWETEHENKWKD